MNEDVFRNGFYFIQIQSIFNELRKFMELNVASQRFFTFERAKMKTVAHAIFEIVKSHKYEEKKILFIPGEMA